ncbi:MAG TPA: hypothetical protein VGL13_11125, partial [Polyangiaceae bacterium]
MSDGPQKPDSIPQSAVWDAEQRKWEIAQHDAEGQRDGERLLYREDGSLYSREHFRAGVPDGPFWVYHPNGAIAREGAYTRGVLDGAVVARRSDGPTFEQLRDCCVPENAWELRFSYRSGALQNETFYDRQGRALLDDGSFYPDRPAGVEPAAYFDQSLRRWRLDTPSEE